MQFFIAVTAIALVSSLYLLRQFATRELAEDEQAGEVSAPEHERLKAA